MSNTQLKKWDEETLDVEYKSEGTLEVKEEGNDTKFIIHLSQKPSSNKFKFKFKGWSKFDFHYQEPWIINGEEVTLKYVDGRPHRRAANVNGSYAVYHKSKKWHKKGKKNYGTGKCWHIYRPKWIDSNGDWTWGELKISGQNYTNTCPQEWLDNAVYPVKCNDTFGETGVGASNGWAGDDEIWASGKGSPSDGTVTDISIYGVFWTISVTVGLYEDDGGPGPDTQTGDEKETLNVTEEGGDWVTLSADNISVSNGTDYWCAANGDIDVYYDVEAGTNRYWDTHTYGDAWPASFTQDSSSGALYSIYATYTPSGTNCQINIGDAWKTVDGFQINIGDAWKTVDGIQINIGDAWKEIF